MVLDPTFSRSLSYWHRYIVDRRNIRMVSSQAGTLPYQVHLPINTHSHQSVLHLYNLQICSDKPGRLLCARISTQLPCPKFSVMEYVVCFAMHRCNKPDAIAVRRRIYQWLSSRANQWFTQFHRLFTQYARIGKRKISGT